MVTVQVRDEEVLDKGNSRSNREEGVNSELLVGRINVTSLIWNSW